MNLVTENVIIWLSFDQIDLYLSKSQVTISYLRKRFFDSFIVISFPSVLRGSHKAASDVLSFKKGKIGTTVTQFDILV